MNIKKAKMLTWIYVQPDKWEQSDDQKNDKKQILK